MARERPGPSGRSRAVRRGERRDRAKPTNPARARAAVGEDVSHPAASDLLLLAFDLWDPALGPVARGQRRESARLCRHGSARDRKSTRLNSSHGYISYAVFCLKKKKKKK